MLIDDRFATGFTHPDGQADWRQAVVDGRQRVETIIAWFDGDLAVPASWFERDLVETTVDIGDGPSVTFTGLSLRGRRLMRPPDEAVGLGGHARRSTYGCSSPLPQATSGPVP